MKEFKMKEATNKKEAIISLLDVQENKPELLPKLIKFDKKELQELQFTEVRDLFIHVKTMYYSSIDWTKKF
jgi:hypothetical protein|tara:strand:- start:219 stop:431 length:213 start_codon:yes stop_codon:yes gene_type:complete